MATESLQVTLKEWLQTQRVWAPPASQMRFSPSSSLGKGAEMPHRAAETENVRVQLLSFPMIRGESRGELS